MNYWICMYTDGWNGWLKGWTHRRTDLLTIPQAIESKSKSIAKSKKKAEKKCCSFYCYIEGI